MKNILIFYLLSIGLFSTTLSFGQINRTNNWFFGHECSVSFNSGSPVPSTSSSLRSIEGCSSISDTDGNLLFYTNGESVWNSNDQIMQNGQNLIGDHSSKQSSLCVPMPENDSLFYLFTTGNFQDKSFYYSIINMNEDGGLGSVDMASKNIKLHLHSTESLTGTYHCNKKDYWVAALRLHGTKLYLYLYKLGSNGICGRIRKIIKTNYTGSRKMHLKFSITGDKLAFYLHDVGIMIYDFDNSTGDFSITDTIPLPYTNESIYSSAFSPDGQKLYTSSWYHDGTNGQSYLSQYDLVANNIAATRTNLDSVDYSNGSPNGFGFIGQIQLAPDHKIYASRWHQKWPYSVDPNSPYSLDSLDVINQPNLLGSASDFERNALYLNSKPTMIGLPNFIDSYLDTTSQSTCSCNICEDATIDVQTACDSLLWIDGNTYTASDSTATHVLTNSAGCDSIVTLNLIVNTVNSNVTQSGTLLTADESGATYQWLQCPAMTPISGATNQSFTATASGNYAVIVDNNGCSDTSACYTVIGVGIIENNFDKELILYPNPTDGNFSIDLGEIFQTVWITITDMNGRLFQSKQYKKSQLFNLRIEEPAGIYLVTLVSGDKKAVIRVVKE